MRGSEILLIHHRFQNPAMFGKWTFPGGRLDPEETDPVAALHREIQEELSVDIEVLGELGVFYNRSGFDYTIFAARPLGDVGPLQSDEIREIVWLTPAEIYEWHTRDKLQFGFEMDAVSAYLKQFA
ncbi:MAG: NUDIX hydrolase [Anaerolineae bacterium]|nr:NUDIX hydrolase [Anaerolineae bacterium]